MNRFVTLGAAAVLVAGCGQIRLPGWQSAGTTEFASEPTQVVSAPAPTVVYEIHQAAPLPAVNANTTYVEIESAPAETVFVVEETPTYVYLPEPRPPIHFVRRPRYAPPPPPPPRPPKPRPPRPPNPQKPVDPPQPPNPPRPPNPPKQPGPPDDNSRPIPPDHQDRPRPPAAPGPSDRPRDSEVGVVTDLLQVWKHVAGDIASAPEPSRAAPPARPQRRAVSEEASRTPAAEQDQAEGERQRDKETE